VIGFKKKPFFDKGLQFTRIYMLFSLFLTNEQMKNLIALLLLVGLTACGSVKDATTDTTDAGTEDAKAVEESTGDDEMDDEKDMEDAAEGDAGLEVKAKVEATGTAPVAPAAQ